MVQYSQQQQQPRPTPNERKTNTRKKTTTTEIPHSIRKKNNKHLSLTFSVGPFFPKTTKSFGLSTKSNNVICICRIQIRAHTQTHTVQCKRRRSLAQKFFLCCSCRLQCSITFSRRSRSFRFQFCICDLAKTFVRLGVLMEKRKIVA